MNSINSSYFNNPHSGFYEPVRPKTFSVKAYSAFPSVSEEDKSDPAFTSVIQELNPSLESQPDSRFFQALPVELQDHVFKFLEPRDLLKCLPTCKQFHVLGAGVLANKAKAHVDFRALENQIDKRLVENKSTGDRNSEEINKTLKQLSSFKAYCILLRIYKFDFAEKIGLDVEQPVSDSCEKSQLVNEIGLINLTLRSIASLQKACQAKLEEIQKHLENRVNAVAQRILNNPNNFRFLNN